MENFDATTTFPLREWFAGMALQGLLASSNNNNSEVYGIMLKDMAKDAYLIADTMIEIRNKTKGETNATR